MDYSYDPVSRGAHGTKHDSFLSPSSHDVYGYSRSSRSSVRLDVPVAAMNRNKSVNERERRPYHYEPDHRSRSSIRREDTYPEFSRRSRSTRRTKSWPPPPSVEDEDESLAREHPRRSSPKPADDEVCMPGTIDQNPVLIDLENHERRFILVPQHDAKEETSQPKQQRPRSEQLPSLRIEVEEPDLFSRRQPSPYAFSKSPGSAGSKESANPLEPSSASPGSATTMSLKDENGKRYKNGNFSSDESELESRAADRFQERKPRLDVPLTGSTSSSSRRPEVKRFNSDCTSPTDSRSHPPTDGSGLCERAPRQPSSAPTSDDEMSSRVPGKSASLKPVDISTQIPLRQRIHAESLRGSKHSLYEASEQERGSRMNTPPGSPKIGERPLQSDYYGTSRSSRQKSYTAQGFEFNDFANDPPRSVSYSNSEQNSAYDYDRRPNSGVWTATPQSQNASFTRSSTLQNDASMSATVLPYPLDDPIVHMPNHEHFIETPTSPAMPNKPYLDAHNAGASNLTSQSTAKRPTFPSRSETTSSVSSASRDSDNANTSLTMPKSLPVCPRMEYSKAYDDWYTLKEDSSFDICPTCLEGIIRKTPFRSEFVPARRRGASVRTRCDFGSPWVRLAWLLTIKRQRKDLELIYALSAISSVDSPCPDTKEGNGPWYGLLSTDGQFIPGFAICSCDTKYIEACFPSLIGLFTRIPDSLSGRDANICSMRISSKRFPTYLDLLEDIDEEARFVPLESAKSLQRLIRVVGAEMPKKKCTRDSLLYEATWYYMPLLPEFTVCEECFDEVIWPSVKQGSQLADRFNKVLKPLPAGVAVEGASCQVYSTRMRRVWERAVKYGEKDGMIYLARKVRERKEVEDDLRRHQKEIARLLDRSKKLGGPTAATDKERLKRELENIEREWADWE
ncbi:uncharacterized protein PV09_02734 [Verruconis gallopava]|uniref:Uncharacterized protein n=1 Tax=Verruconis gallopava TaxID=253628 RepID=A0A0D1YZX8_9PEZI|nr:uncharacterized protein PV09_02734 [Verruconis gallopava]KIW06262.1 hypothetical protein PV09_02734 [Verruconis gallopava]